MRTLMVSRRLVLGFVAAMPLAGGLAGTAPAAAPLEDQLKAALAWMEMPWAAEFRLIRFGQRDAGRDIELTTVVEMAWPPGMRRRKFTARDRVPDFALTALIEQIETEFRSAG